MFPIFRNILSAVRYPLTQMQTSSFHLITSNINKTHIPQPKQFLAPTSYSLIQNCGFKVKGLLKRRCKDCFFVRRQERLYVLCKTHGRHKQMSMMKSPKNTWTLTHATQSKVRPW